MKAKVTRKSIMQAYPNVVCVGYCHLQFLLGCESPAYYTTRREGWGADIYTFGNTAIVTGYSSFGNVRPPYDLVKNYERRAEGIAAATTSWQERQESLSKLLREFLAEIIQ